MQKTAWYGLVLGERYCSHLREGLLQRRVRDRVMLAIYVHAIGFGRLAAPDTRN